LRFVTVNTDQDTLQRTTRRDRMTMAEWRRAVRQFNGAAFVTTCCLKRPTRRRICDAAQHVLERCLERFVQDHAPGRQRTGAYCAKGELPAARLRLL
jgi:hypothetical protein